MNHTRLDVVRSMMTQANLQISYWDVLLIVAYILNQVPLKSIPSTTYKLWIVKKLIQVLYDHEIQQLTYIIFLISMGNWTKEEKKYIHLVL